MWNLVGANKICTDRNIAREHMLHLARLKKMKSTVNCNPPRTMSHLKVKAKKEQIKRDKEEIVEHDNKLLLKKMLEIDKKPSSVTPRCLGTPRNKSLNKVNRLNELSRIARENRKILKQIQLAKPSYSNHKLKKDYEYKQYLSHNLSENAGRVPRSVSFTSESFVTSSVSIEAPRPLSAVQQRSVETSLVRPMTADGRNRIAKSFL
ncbi:unnamed protein product [Blepharisma stoltei]|uniref:Uncharacterized protein n=1 Tax=Blepharisma stoltei TaxID=1481888 RepID=A0AAU9K8S3_9CILI|nr:unnamed protein product [Blepharisma stoltei]